MATPITTIKCVSLTSIDGTDCIGDTRNVINTNVNNLGRSVCTLFSTITAVTADFNTRIVNFSAFVKSLSAKDSSTVDLFFNPHAYILSADVTNSSLGTIKLGSDITTFGKRLLTSTNIPLSSIAGVTLTGTPNVGDIFAWNGTTWTNATQTSGTFTVGNKGDINVVTSDFWNINPGVVDTNELADSAVETSKINNGAVTTSKLASAVGFEAVAAANIQTNAVTTAKISAEAVTNTKLATDSVTTAKIDDATSTITGVTNSKLRYSSSCSVIGRSVNSTGAPADIQATANDTVLVRTGNTLQFNIVPNAATTGSSNNNGNTLVLRNASGNFTTNVITATATTFGFVGNLQGRALSADEATKLRTSRRIELSGSVVGVANFDGTATATINTTFGNANALTVLGRSANSTGPIASIAAEANNRVLLRKDNELVFDIVPNTATTGTSAADANTLVLRNNSGSFVANNITVNSGITATNITATNNITATGNISGARLFTNTGEVKPLSGIKGVVVNNSTLTSILSADIEYILSFINTDLQPYAAFSSIW